MASVPQLLHLPFDLYVDQAEAWKHAHVEAMHCRDVEQAVRFGLFIIHDIQRENSRWAQEVQCGAAPFSWQEAEQFAECYQWWLERSRLLLDEICRCEAVGFDVEQAAAFREQYREISLLPLDIAKVQRSVESLEQGGGISHAQALHALRNPVR